jgi:hypothetical protein
MWLYRQEAERILGDAWSGLHLGLEKKLSLVKKIGDDDDWSFVIKAHALIEAAVTSSVVAHSGNERLKRTIERLSLIGDNVSKLALAKEFALMSPEQCRFVKMIAKLRNKLAHEIDQIDFTFEAYMASLDSEAKSEWQQSIVWFASDRRTREVWCRIATATPKTALYSAVYLLISLLYLDESTAEANRTIKMVADQTTKELFGSTEDLT